MADLCVHVALALFGVFVFRIFRQVTVRASDGDFLGKLDVELMLERIDFLLELLLDFCKGSVIRLSRVLRKMMRSSAKPNSARAPL